MARYSGGANSATAGSITNPLMSIYAGVNAGGTLREIGVTNSTNTQWAVKLVRLTTAGTQGVGITRARQNPNSLQTANCTLFQSHISTGPTLGDDLGYRMWVGAAIGSGGAFTFGADGLVIPVGTTNGVGVIVDTGSGQISEIYFVWDE